MAINPQEAELRRLTNIKALVRKEIDTTNDIRKKEVLRKKHEGISKDLDTLLKDMKLI